MENLEEEMSESQTFSSFKHKIDEDLEKQDRFDQLRRQEKELNNEIKQINEDLKKKQDDFALEAQESSDEILNQKKRCNETKTERELQVQYKQREIEGKLACKKRMQSMDETGLREQIKTLSDALEVEKLVSTRIQEFIIKKKKIIEQKSDERDRLREKKVKILTNEKEEIQTKQEDASNETQDMQKKCN